MSPSLFSFFSPLRFSLSRTLLLVVLFLRKHPAAQELKRLEREAASERERADGLAARLAASTAAAAAAALAGGAGGGANGGAGGSSMHTPPASPGGSVSASPSRQPPARRLDGGDGDDGDDDVASQHRALLEQVAGLQGCVEGLQAALVAESARAAALERALHAHAAAAAAAAVAARGAHGSDALAAATAALAAQHAAEEDAEEEEGCASDGGA
jgi:hypothetical protein